MFFLAEAIFGTGNLSIGIGDCGHSTGSLTASNDSRHLLLGQHCTARCGKRFAPDFEPMQAQRFSSVPKPV